MSVKPPWDKPRNVTTFETAPTRRPKSRPPAPVDQLVLPPPSDPMAVARTVIKALYTTPDGLRLRYHRGLPYRWTGTCWPEIAPRDVRSAAYHYLEPAWYEDPERGPCRWAPSRRKLDDLLDALQAITLVPSHEEAPTWIEPRGVELPASDIVAMRNGLLHVSTRRLVPHTPLYFGHHALPFDYVADPPAPAKWLAFLRQLWPDDSSSIDALQEVMGYLLAGDTRQQKIFMMVGPKRGGKGTIARVLTGLLGRHNTAAPTLASLATNFGLSPLIGRPVAIVSDARLSAKTESSIVVERLLSVSGEDSLTIDRKYREPWTGRLGTRFLILSNELPRLTDASGALSSRFILFVLQKSFYGVENPELTEELLDEAPSIFGWALEGLDRLTHRGRFEQPAASREALQRLEDLASPIGAFLRARCIIASAERVSCDALWDIWKGWCEGENRAPGTKAVFGRDLHAAVPTIKRARLGTEDRQYAYAGIGIRREDYSGDVLGRQGREDESRPGRPRTRAMYPPHDEDDHGDHL